MNVAPIDILLVEDNPDHALLTVEGLNSNGVLNNVIVVRDGEEALDYLRGTGPYQSENRPGLILLDINLPKVNGLQVLEQIKGDEGLKAIPVVMLTTSEDEREVQEAYALGANSYVVKPVTFRDFVERVRRLEMYWVLVNRPPDTP